MTEKTVTAALELQNDYRFSVRFDDAIPVLTADEPAPLGTGTGPSPVQLPGAAVGAAVGADADFAQRHALF